MDTRTSPEENVPFGKHYLDQYIFSLHQLLGHDKAAGYLGVDVGDKRYCFLCHPELKDE